MEAERDAETSEKRDQERDTKGGREETQVWARRPAGDAQGGGAGCGGRSHSRGFPGSQPILSSVLFDFSLYKLPFDLWKSWEPEPPSPSPCISGGGVRPAVSAPPCLSGLVSLEESAVRMEPSLRLGQGHPPCLSWPMASLCPTPERGPHFCPRPARPASLPGLTRTYASWDRPETPEAIS